MTPAYRLTERAVRDLYAIWSYIADDNFDAAERVESAIYDALELLAGSPLLGSKRPHYTSRAVRFWTVPAFPNYTIVYDPEAKPLQIVAILHGKRDIGKILARSSHS